MSESFSLNEYFPPVLANAISEAVQITQAPTEMVGAAALGVASLACQQVIEVVRPGGLVSPCSLFLLTIADSGERKTAINRLFLKPIFDFEAEKSQDAKDELVEFETDLYCWSAQEKSLKRALNQVIKAQTEATGSVDTQLGYFGAALKEVKSVGSEKNLADQFERIKRQLLEHAKTKPVLPKTPRLIYGDTTSEALLSGLDMYWPNAGLINDEANFILNGRAFSDLSILNKLWDGEQIQVDRKLSKSFVVKGASMTLSLMIQEQLFWKFFEARGDEARKIGFSSRLLACIPPSNIGARNYSRSSQLTSSQDGLKRFNKRVSELLHRGYSTVRSEKSKEKVEMTEDAQREWGRLCDVMEDKIKSSIPISFVPDHVSKFGDNLARVAAIFHFIEGGEGKVSKATLIQANNLLIYYTVMYIRILAESANNARLHQAANLLIDWFKHMHAQGKIQSEVHRSYILQFGPKALRTRSTLCPVLDYLEATKHLKQVETLGTSENKPTHFIDISGQTWLTKRASYNTSAPLSTGLSDVLHSPNVFRGSLPRSRTPYQL